MPERVADGECAIVDGVVEVVARAVELVVVRVGGGDTASRLVDAGPVVLADGAAEEPALDRQEVTALIGHLAFLEIVLLAFLRFRSGNVVIDFT